MKRPLEKEAAGELTARFARWLSTPIPGTPKLVQKVRNKSELDGLEQGIRDGAERYITGPLERGLTKIKADKALGGAAGVGARVFKRGMTPEARKEWAGNAGKKAVKFISEKPHLALAHSPIIPIPGTGILAEGIEHGKNWFLNKTPGLPVLKKHANGDMMEYFQKNPQKYEEYKARREAKKRKSGKEKAAMVMPYQQKTQWTCSAACLKAVLAHYGLRVPELAAIELVGAKKGRGAETTQIADAARKLGFEAFEYSFDSLEQAALLLNEDIPIICDIQSFNHPGKGHYVVMTGYDGKNVLLMDPNVPGNLRVISAAEMNARWWDRAMAPPHELMPKWGIVILPPR